MRSADIRQHFLDFFEGKGHKIVASAPIVQKNDPTLMFTNAGMNQFKDIFLGNRESAVTRIADTQKCLRVSGKHNDLEEVGLDTYHHTMFEMLGNWSFGDYFKPEAIAWAYELLTEVYKLDPARLYFTVFEGDKADGLSADSESLEQWKKLVPQERILFGNKKDNFWEMGDYGPCGPSSEIHFDIRSDEEIAEQPGKELVNSGHPEVIEIWNLVFIEFNRLKSGKLEKLPAQHVDTGMGFERLATVLQKKRSNYDTDIFQPLIMHLQNKFGIKYGTNHQADVAFRVVADHIRAITFTIADGQLPSNTGAGYVIRRILRRAVRYGYRYFEADKPFLHELVPILAEQFSEVFPEVVKQQDLIQKVVQEEENSFLRTLAVGTKLFEKYTEELEGKEIDGKFAFELLDTYGFPIDLTRLMAHEIGLHIDEEAFRKELEQQKTRSRKASAKDEGEWVIVQQGKQETSFIGYDALEAEVQILRYREVMQKDKTLYHLVFDKTPFYPEGGGQVGDTGTLERAYEKIRVIDTRKENELIIHETEELPSEPEKSLQAIVDGEKRLQTAANHTATHLLHAALRKVLGEHVTQKGSLVAPTHLRFDFSHFSKVTDEEVKEIEAIVNEKVRANLALEEHRGIPLKEAQEKGAMALFGEKYGESVRMICFGDEYSRELCGGTHLMATGQIGQFRITTETAVSAGVRRIEAVTGKAAEDYVNNRIEELELAKALIKGAKDLPSAIKSLQEENKSLQQQLEEFSKEKLKGVREELAGKVQQVNGKQVIAEQVELNSADEGKNLVYDLKNKLPEAVIILGAAIDEKALLWVMVPENLTKQGLHAGNIVREAAKEVQGGGGGQPFFATAGGKNASNIQKALEKAVSLIS